MASPRAPLAFVSIILIAGGLLLTLFILIAGTTDHVPVNKFYFLRADTSGIPGAAPETRWTLWNACSEENGKNACPKVHPAYPFDPSRNFKTTQGVPKQLIKGKQYYYATRFMFAFILIQGFFAVVAFFTSVLALCSRIGSFLTSFTISIALFFQTIAAALMTAFYVKGRNAFRSSSTSAGVGNYNFGFMWAIFAAYFISMVLLCAGGAASSRGGGGGRSSKRERRRFGFLGRNKSTASRRDRGSFGIDKEAAVDGDRSSFVRGT